MASFKQNKSSNSCITKNRIKVYHFHNGSGGGVLSVISNLIRFRQHDEIEYHIIYTINKKTNPYYKVPEIKGVVSSQVFYYSLSWNYYYLFNKLKTLLPDEKAVIVAHDWIELGMVSNIGLQNPVVFFLHGDFNYYYNLASLHCSVIDKFITVSHIIEKKLYSKIDRRDDIRFLRFPIANNISAKPHNNILKIIYYVRDLREERKQFLQLPIIEKALRAENIIVNWIIAGGGLSKSHFYLLWGRSADNVDFLEQVSNEKILEKLPECDLFILPSLSEGLPVSMVEAMKAGVVPLITNWEGATEDLVIENHTGFYFEIGDTAGYSRKISELHFNRALLQKLSEEASLRSNLLFDPVKNTEDIEEFVIEVIRFIKIKKANRVYGSRLDKTWLPNSLVTNIRRFIKR